MFYCKFCGYVSQDSNAASCGNRVCRGYLRHQAVRPLEFSAPPAAAQDSPMPAPPPMPAPMPSVPYPSDKHALAFATVPFQRMGQLLPQASWLTLGTVFPELSMPYPRKIFDRCV